MKGIIPFNVFWAALIFKLFAGVTMGLIFYHYYGYGDSIHYFELATQLIKAHSDTPVSLWNIQPEVAPFYQQPRVLFFVRILATTLYFCNGSYWISCLYFSLFSFACYWYFAFSLAKIRPEYKWPAIISMLLVPSVIFWSSGILKGTLSNPALIFAVLIVLKVHWKQKIRWWEVIGLAIATVVLWKLKHYLLISFLFFTGALLAIFIHKKLSKRYRWIASISMIFAAVTLSQFIHPYLTFQRIPLTLYENNQAIIEKSDSSLGVELATPTWQELFKKVPSALYTGLTRPSFFDATSIWGIVHQIENFLLVALGFLSIILGVRNNVKPDWPLLLISISIICLLATTLTISTPNFGSLVRYKNAFMPFCFLIVTIIPFQHLTSKTN